VLSRFLVTHTHTHTNKIDIPNSIPELRMDLYINPDLYADYTIINEAGGGGVKNQIFKKFSQLNWHKQTFMPEKKHFFCCQHELIYVN